MMVADDGGVPIDVAMTMLEEVDHSMIAKLTLTPNTLYRVFLSRPPAPPGAEYPISPYMWYFHVALEFHEPEGSTWRVVD